MDYYNKSMLYVSLDLTPFLMALEAGKANIHILSRFISGERCLLRWKVLSNFLLCVHV